MNYILTVFRFSSVKGIFACKSVADISLCTVEKQSLLLRCCKSVILFKADSTTAHKLSPATTVSLGDSDYTNVKLYWYLM